RMKLRHAKRSRTAHGQSGEIRSADPKRVHERERIRNEKIETVAPRRRIGPPVAALIVTQHPERALELARLVLPCRKIGRERVAENEPRRGTPVRGPVELVIDTDAVCLDLHLRLLNRRAPALQQRRPARPGNLPATAAMRQPPAPASYEPRRSIRSARREWPAR